MVPAMSTDLENPSSEHERTFWQTGWQTSCRVTSPRHVVTARRYFSLTAARCRSDRSSLERLGKGASVSTSAPSGPTLTRLSPRRRRRWLLNVKLTGERQTVRGGKYV